MSGSIGVRSCTAISAVGSASIGSSRSSGRNAGASSSRIAASASATPGSGPATSSSAAPCAVRFAVDPHIGASAVISRSRPRARSERQAEEGGK
jgi:hypothetical protein